MSTQPPRMHITPLGDLALTLHLCEEFEDDPARCLAVVLDALHRLEAAVLPGVMELSPAYSTIGVFFDPTAVESVGMLEQKIGEVVGAAASAGRGAAVRDDTARSFEIEVCYEGEFAPDLEDVARQAGVSAEDVVRLQSAAEYRVHFVGFTAGFPYLDGLPGKLATPRRSTPRTYLPAGSVAIGGAQLGIYSVPSPGGWNVIGRTAMRLFDARQDPPALLRAGDLLRFRAISADEFQRQDQ